MQTKKAKKFPQIRVSEEVFKRLKRMAKVRGWSLGYLIENLINK
jgi:predicted HicB family RNase H-like nuclease